jgi:hypothetical protein
MTYSVLSVPSRDGSSSRITRGDRRAGRVGLELALHALDAAYRTSDTRGTHAAAAGVTPAWAWLL